MSELKGNGSTPDERGPFQNIDLQEAGRERSKESEPAPKEQDREIHDISESAVDSLINQTSSKGEDSDLNRDLDERPPHSEEEESAGESVTSSNGADELDRADYEAAFDEIFNDDEDEEGLDSAGESYVTNEATGGRPSSSIPVDRRLSSPGDNPVAMEPDLEQRSDLGAHLWNGIRHYHKGNYEDAIIEFKQAARIDASFRKIDFMIGNSFFKNRMFDEAIATYEKLKELRPRDIYVYENLGYIHASQGNYELAAQEWKKFSQLVPERFDIKHKINKASHRFASPSPEEQEMLKLLLAGIEDYRRHNYDVAIHAFDLATRRYPESREAHSFLGGAYFKNGQFADAIDALRRAARIEEGNAVSLENLGLALAKQGEYDQAINEWGRLLRINPWRTDIIQKIDCVIKRGDQANSSCIHEQLPLG